MKKILIVLSLCLLGMTSTKGEAEEIVIPKEAIRFRVIANSNNKEDQQIKGKVKEALQEDLSILLKDSQGVEDTRAIIKNNQKRYEKIISKTLMDNKANPNYQVHYGLNYFPQKVYKGVTYEEGYYESLVVTLGGGDGDNWWCVLFPPLCLLEENDSKTSDVEYKSYVKELVEKYF